jgi:hypothetical protein
LVKLDALISQESNKLGGLKLLWYEEGSINSVSHLS